MKYCPTCAVQRDTYTIEAGKICCKICQRILERPVRAITRAFVASWNHKSVLDKTAFVEVTLRAIQRYDDKPIFLEAKLLVTPEAFMAAGFSDIGLNRRIIKITMEVEE
jgi:hypothetical protein